MNRPYINTEDHSVQYFIGEEVENTIAKGMQTLFVVGSPDIKDITAKLHVLRVLCHQKNIDHVYFGANKSFNRDFDFALITAFLRGRNKLVTLDFPFEDHEFVRQKMDRMYEDSNFIPMISLEVPCINSVNYNATLKIDDEGFNKTNPGVWCHSIHQLKSKEAFTPWIKYTQDSAL